MADLLLHINDGVIDERADGNGHAAKRHGVDARTKRLQRQHCDDKRDWDGQQRDDARSHTGQEGDDDEDDHDAAVAERFDGVVNRNLDEVSFLAADLDARTFYFYRSCSSKKVRLVWAVLVPIAVSIFVFVPNIKTFVPNEGLLRANF